MVGSTEQWLPFILGRESPKSAKPGDLIIVRDFDGVPDHGVIGVVFTAKTNEITFASAGGNGESALFTAPVRLIAAVGPHATERFTELF